MKNYEKGNMEDSDSGGDIHLDSGTDRTWHGLMHGSYDVRRLMAEVRVNSDECPRFFYEPRAFLRLTSYI